MGNTSVSKSSVVTLTKTPICATADCKNRVAFGKIYCTLHDMNPMLTGRPKEEEKKVESKEEKCCDPCCCFWVLLCIKN